MPFQKKSFPNTILFIIAILTIGMGLLLYLSPPAVFPDPGWGFQVMRSMQMGAGFNQLIKPSQLDISKNTTEFLTWWSPGQYLVPWLFLWLFGINTGQALAITVTICQLLGLSGFYYFFKKIGFSPIIASVSIAFIACQQAYMLPYLFYNGGEILLFAFTGWFLYGCTILQKPGWQLCLFVLFTGWIGFFCKSSVMWIYGAGLFYLWLRLSLPQKTIINHIKKGLWIGVPAITSLISIYIFFLSKGQNPASASGGLEFTLQTFTFPLASPLLAGFSMDDLAHGLLFHSGIPVFSTSLAIMLIVILAIISLLILYCIISSIPNNNYKQLLLVFYAVSLVFFSYAYLRQMAISYEARHYRMIGLIITPGIIYLIAQLKTAYRVCFGLIWVGIAYSSFHYLAKGYGFNQSKSAHGITGIAQPSVDQRSLDYITALDLQQHNAIFAFATDDIGLEIKQNRIITLEQISDYDHINIEDYEYDGHAGPLYILLPQNYDEKKIAIILKFFPGYHDFMTTPVSSQYILYSAN